MELRVFWEGGFSEGGPCEAGEVTLGFKIFGACFLVGGTGGGGRGGGGKQGVGLRGLSKAQSGSITQTTQSISGAKHFGFRVLAFRILGSGLLGLHSCFPKQYFLFRKRFMPASVHCTHLSPALIRHGGSQP